MFASCRAFRSARKATPFGSLPRPSSSEESLTDLGPVAGREQARRYYTALHRASCPAPASPLAVAKENGLCMRAHRFGCASLYQGSSSFSRWRGVSRAVQRSLLSTLPSPPTGGDTCTIHGVCASRKIWKMSTINRNWCHILNQPIGWCNAPEWTVLTFQLRLILRSQTGAWRTPLQCPRSPTSADTR